MEKIKLEWNEKIHQLTMPFDINGKNYWFGVFSGIKVLNLYTEKEHNEYPKNNSGNEDNELGFPQNYQIESKEEGRKFCQDWLDNFIDNENRKEREKKIRGVLEEIWNGKTELKWEDRFSFFYFQEKPFHFYFGTLGSRIYESHVRYSFTSASHSFGYNESLKTKEEIQDWYNKFLLEQASQ